MDTLSYKTISANKETATKEWVVVDATDQVLGRLGAKVAKLLRGKYKPNFTPNADCGDNVIIINADKVVLTGNKWTDRVYLRHTGYPGGQREMTPAALIAIKSIEYFFFIHLAHLIFFILNLRLSFEASQKFKKKNILDKIKKTDIIVCHAGTHHLTAIKNKKFWDSWDCSSECIGIYWIKKSK